MLDMKEDLESMILTCCLKMSRVSKEEICGPPKVRILKLGAKVEEEADFFLSTTVVAVKMEVGGDKNRTVKCCGGRKGYLGKPSGS